MLLQGILEWVFNTARWLISWLPVLDFGTVDLTWLTATIQGVSPILPMWALKAILVQWLALLSIQPVLIIFRWIRGTS